MENYYQESGRAGRDDSKSHCILFYRPFDVFQQSTMVFTEQTGECIRNSVNNIYIFFWSSSQVVTFKLRSVGEVRQKN